MPRKPKTKPRRQRPKEYYRLPVDGYPNKVTTDVKKYLAAWRKIAKPFLAIPGVETYAFDPDVCFWYKGKVVSLPRSFAVVVGNALTGKL